MIKLVAIDLDGTLLNSHKIISRENIETLQLAMEKGVKIVICSGRIFKGARIYANLVSTTAPLIACNGAVIKDMDTQETLYANTLKKEDCLSVIDICHREEIYFHLYIEDTLYTESMKFGSAFYLKMNEELAPENRINILLEKDLGQILRTSSIPPLKIVVESEDHDKLSRVKKLVTEIQTVEVVSSHFDNFEVMNQGVSKGSALKFLGEKYGLDKNEIMAIGDNENDLSMLEYAGLGVAMGNGEDFVKEKVGHITLDNDNHGVAEAIKKYVL